MDSPGEAFWPQWRGPYATGASNKADPPTEWSETKNVRWRMEIPGRGFSSPVVWGERVYVLTAVPKDVDAAASHQPRGMVTPRIVHRYVVMAINRKDGKIVWERTAREAEPHEGAHSDNGSWASSSAITDGQHVIASFESQGAVRVRHERQAGMGKGSRRQTHAQPVR
jgi:outer membrane protein assembly factor BamB